MLMFILRRLLSAIPTLILVSLFVFTLQKLLPGDPVLAMAGEERDPAVMEYLRDKYRLNDPIPVQYLNWVGNVLTGDFGTSLRTEQPVTTLLASKLPVTLELAVLALLIALLIGIPTGIISAVRKGTVVDYGANVIALSGISIPHFWLGILLIMGFSIALPILPSSGHVPLLADPVEALRHLALPALTLGIYVSGILARFLRASLVSELRADYVRTARSKGLPERQVVGTHIMRNALLPFITIVGLMMANFIGGAVVTEAVFTYPGIGRLLIQAISTRDYPLIQGCIVVILVLYIGINMAVDVLYAYIDPRIDYS